MMTKTRKAFIVQEGLTLFSESEQPYLRRWRMPANLPKVKR